MFLQSFFEFNLNLYKMKKILILIAAALFSVGVSAQTTKEIKESAQRVSQISSLLSPETCSLESVNNVASKATVLAKETVDISDKIEQARTKLDAMKAMKSGTASALDKAALLKTCKELATKAISQSSGVTNSLGTLSKLSGEISAVKDATQLIAVKKSVDKTKNLLNLVNNETSYQVKTVGNMISTIKALK